MHSLTILTDFDALSAAQLEKDCDLKTELSLKKIRQCLRKSKLVSKEDMRAAFKAYRKAEKFDKTDFEELIDILKSLKKEAGR